MFVKEGCKCIANLIKPMRTLTCLHLTIVHEESITYPVFIVIITVVDWLTGVAVARRCRTDEHLGNEYSGEMFILYQVEEL